MTQSFHYVALIRKSPESAFGVEFPDFPGCMSGGDTLEEAVQGAREALALHLRGMKQDNETVPEPRDFHAILALSPDNRDALAVHIEPAILDNSEDLLRFP